MLPVASPLISSIIYPKNIEYKPKSIQASSLTSPAKSKIASTEFNAPNITELKVKHSFYFSYISKA